MQLALSCAPRQIIYVLVIAWLEAGVSMKSLLSHAAVRGEFPFIPDGKRVGPVGFLKSGVGVARSLAADKVIKSAPCECIPCGDSSPHEYKSGSCIPSPESEEVHGFECSSSEGTFETGCYSSEDAECDCVSKMTKAPSEWKPIEEPKVQQFKKVWAIEAVVEMQTLAPMFMNELSASIPGFALTVADRLQLATGVPLSRFTFYIPDPNGMSSTNQCQSINEEGTRGAQAARFSDASNSSFECTQTTWKLNQTWLAGREGSLLQEQSSMSLQERSNMSWEVGVYPATGILGDTKSGKQVVKEIVELSTANPEPKRKLLRSGLWTYQKDTSVKFLGLFPGTSAGFAGDAFPQARETAIRLGPNPGGHGAAPTTTMDPTFFKALGDDAAAMEYLSNVDGIVNATNTVNTQISDSVADLGRSLARASAAHSAVLNIDPYVVPPELA